MVTAPSAPSHLVLSLYVGAAPDVSAGERDTQRARHTTHNVAVANSVMVYRVHDARQK